MDLLVSTDNLATMLAEPDLRLFDATYFALEPERGAAMHFAAGHIPGARFLDLEQFVDPDDPAPFMLPSSDVIAGRLSALGLDADRRIVLYDDTPHRTAARAWWMLRLAGACNVALLDGGLAKWRREDRPMETGPGAAAGSGEFVASLSRRTLRSKAEMQALLHSGAEQIVDARSASRFTGAEPDPRGGVAPGHIPGSINLPYGHLFKLDGTWKRGDMLRAVYTDAGIDLRRPIVTTCGSGVTAAILLFGLALLGKDDVALYDGSWSEWGADPVLPKVLGA